MHTVHHLHCYTVTIRVHVHVHVIIITKHIHVHVFVHVHVLSTLVLYMYYLHGDKTCGTTLHKKPVNYMYMYILNSTVYGKKSISMIAL